MSEPIRRAPPARPGLLSRPGYLRALVVLLIVLSGLAVILGLRHRSAATAYRIREARHHRTMWRVEQLRAALWRAEQMGRLPELDGGIVEDIRGQCDGMVEEANEGLALAPESDELFRLRGRALEMKHDFENALKDYDEALDLVARQTARYRDKELAPVSTAAVPRGLLRTRLLLRGLLVGRDDEALRKGAYEDLREAFRCTDDWALRPLLAGAQALVLRREDEAVTQAGVAMNLNPTDPWPPLLRGVARAAGKRPAEAGDDFERAARILPYLPEAHAWRGAMLRRLDRREEAMEALARAILVDPNFGEAYHVRGLLFAEDGRHADAEVYFAKAAQLMPSHRESHLGRARAAYEAWARGGRKPESVLRRALEATDAAGRLEPPDETTLVLRARIRLGLGDARGAREEAEKALSARESADGRRVLAEAHATLGDWTSAAAAYGKAGARRERAAALAKAGRHAEALAEYDELLKADPKDVSLALERARALLGAGQAQAALAAIDELLLRQPGSGVARLLKAEILLARKDWDGAIRESTTVFDADPSQADALLVRGRAHAGRGDRTSARKDWEKAKVLAPGRTDEIDALLQSLEP